MKAKKLLGFFADASLRSLCIMMWRDCAVDLSKISNPSTIALRNGSHLSRTKWFEHTGKATEVIALNDESLQPNDLTPSLETLLVKKPGYRFINFGERMK